MAIDKNKIEDFSDLGQPYYFKYGETLYRIPPVSSKSARKMLNLGRELSIKYTRNEKLIKQYEEKGEEIPEELTKQAEEMFDYQIDFILMTNIEESSDDGKKWGLVKKEAVEDVWSTKLIFKIFKKINDILTDVDDQEKKS